MIRTILIDDEEPARILVSNFLVNFSEIEIVGSFADGFSGLKAINELKPDLVFLDIQMPKLTGFEMLELLENKPMIIFTTAYDQYAFKAFEINAIDYLLKPFTRDRFSLAITKVIQNFKENTANESPIQKLINTINDNEEYLNRIAVKTGTKINVIPVSSVIYLEAEGDYVTLHTTEGRFLKEKTMKYFESHLDNKQFVRIHRSYIVNVNEILRIELYEKESYQVFLKDKSKLKASSTGYKLLKQLLNI